MASGGSRGTRRKAEGELGDDPETGVPSETYGELVSAGMQVTRGTARKGARKGAPDDGASVASGETVKMVIVWTNKVCALCKTSEKEKDPVKPHLPYKWGYPVDSVTNQNRGDVCFYCLKVYRARFKTKAKSVQALLAAFGSDMALLQTFKYWRTMCITIMQEQGSWDIYVRWGDEDVVKRLVVRMMKETRITDPEDEVWEWDAYCREFGDPRTNGKGHRYVNLGGISGVLVPGRRVWKVSRSTVMQAGIEEERGNSNFELGKNSLHEQMNDIADGFLQVTATGVTIDQLFSGATPVSNPLKPPPGPPLRQSADAAAPPPGAGTGSASVGSDLFSFAVEDLFGGQGPAPAAKGKAKAKGRAGRSGGGAPRASGSAGVATQGTSDPPAGAGTQRGGAGRGPGRPRRDLEAEATKLFEEFAQAEQTNVKFFGSERKRQLRWMQDFAKSVESARDEHDKESVEWTKFEELRKRCTATNSIVAALHKHPLQSKEFADCYAEAKSFLRVGDVVVADFACPSWIHQSSHATVAEHMCCGSAFWEQLRPESLRAATFDEVMIPTTQMDLAVRKVTALSRCSGKELASDLLALSDPAAYQGCDLGETIIKQLEFVKLLADSSDPLDVQDKVLSLKGAVDAVPVPGNKLLAAVGSYPDGRALLSDANARLKVAEGRRAQASQAAVTLQRLSAIVPDVGKANWTLAVETWTGTNAELKALFIGAAAVPDDLKAAGLTFARRLWRSVAAQLLEVLSSDADCTVFLNALASMKKNDFLFTLDDSCAACFAAVDFALKFLTSLSECSSTDMKTIADGSVDDLAKCLAPFRSVSEPPAATFPADVCKLGDEPPFNEALAAALADRRMRCHEHDAVSEITNKLSTLINADAEFVEEHIRSLDKLASEESQAAFRLRIQRLEELGKKMDDVRFVEQLGVALDMGSFFISMSACGAAWSNAESRTLDARWYDLLLPFLRCEAALKAQLARDNFLATIFSTPQVDDIGHTMTFFDDLELDVTAAVAGMAAKAASVVKGLTLQWTTYGEDLCQRIMAACPAWEQAAEKSGDLLTPELRADLMKKLDAPGMSAVMEAAGALKVHGEMLVKFAAAGFDLIHVDTRLSWEKAVVFGYNSVTLAYAVYRLFVVIPKITNAAMRSKNAMELRKALVAKKTFTIFSSLDKAIAEVEQAAEGSSTKKPSSPGSPLAPGV